MNNVTNAVSALPQQKALGELVSSGMCFALIRAPEVWEDSGDIDILVRDVDESGKLLNSLGYIELITSRHNKKFVKYDDLSGSWIHFDLLSAFKFGNLVTPFGFTDDLLESSFFSIDGIPRLHHCDEEILLLLHYSVEKKSFSGKYKLRILNANLAELRLRENSYKFLPKSLTYYLEILEAIQNGYLTEKEAIERIRSTFPAHLAGNVGIFRRVFRRLSHLLRGNQAIVFLGPDGSGKSTITEKFARLRWPTIRCQYMGPARGTEIRPFFFIALRFFDSKREKYSKKTPVGIVVRICWQLVCYIDFIDRLYRHLWFWSSGGVVIFDRYACDMYFRKPTRLNEFLFMKLFPKPRFVFLCVGDAESIYKRKPEELSPKDIEDTMQLYRFKLEKYCIPYFELNTTEYPPSELLRQVVESLLAHSSNGSRSIE